MSRLAEAIATAAARDRHRIREAERIDRLRAAGAADLYSICRELVDSLNARLIEPAVVLDPPVYSPENFDDSRPNLFQINLRGRLLQIAFAATPELISTEDFRSPYILSGAVRSFNQELLDRHGMEEQNIFYCLDGAAGRWFFSDRRAYRNGRLTADFFARELERLL
ncbi:MAG TPA: hypothetical protein VG345_01005 [Bryobacteraceae bacterium]|nr:hypothetical protein [Bryobacteraceae bacterium]